MKSVLVIGGGRGIGRAVVLALQDDGYEVDYTSTQARSDLEASGRILCDLADSDSVDQLVAHIGSRNYYAVVYNAGVAVDGLVSMLDLPRARRAMEVNFWGFARVAKAAIPTMARARTGRIIAISSVAANQASKGNAIYSASKAALAAFTRGLNSEVAARGIACNTVHPGIVETDMMKPYQADWDKFRARIPAKRLGSSGEVANAVRFLCSEGASYVGGSAIVVDGGLSSSLGW